MFISEIKFDTKDLYVAREILRKIGTFPISVWNNPLEQVKKLFRERRRKITSFSVSKRERNWRKWAARTRKRVLTYIGNKKSVLGGPRVGLRTGTFLEDYSELKSPGISIKIGPGPYGVEYGELIVGVDSEKFHNKYPEKFDEYLRGRNILPNGLTGLEEAEEDFILDSLEREVGDQILNNWSGKV